MTFFFVPGAGSADNALFAIVGSEFKTAGPLDFEAQSSYSVRVRVTDSLGLIREEVSTISVTDVPESGPSITGFDVQNGQAQRSFVNRLDVTVSGSSDLAALLASGRIRLTRFDLAGGGTGVAAGLGTVTRNGGVLTFDFGAQGVGGNRSSTTGNGVYVLEFDFDGNGVFEAGRRFYRLMGALNGDKKVDSTDQGLMEARLALGPAQAYAPAFDLDGNGVVDARDRTVIRRSLGRQITAAGIDD